MSNGRGFNKPGDLLKQLLEDKGWSQVEFADMIGRPAQAVNEILRGEKAVTPETAILFEAAFGGVDAQEWLNLEQKFRLMQAREVVDEPAVKKRMRLYSEYPVAELTRMGELPKMRGLGELEAALIDFYGVSSLKDVVSDEVLLRKGTKANPDPNALAAWVACAKRKAKSIDVPAFNPEGLIDNIYNLRRASAIADKPKQYLSKLLRDVGIRFVEQPHLQQTYVDGAAFWLDNSPVVAVSMRYNRIDNLWFTVMHELAHILLHREAQPTNLLVDVHMDGHGIGIEQEANNKAREWLIPNPAYRDFVQRSRGRFTKGSIERFADDQEIDPGIVVGRLQFDGLLGYNQMRDLLKRVPA